MSESVLWRAAQDEDSARSCVLWLQGGPYPFQDDDLNTYSRNDFATYFLSYLKTKTQKFLHTEDQQVEATVESETNKGAIIATNNQALIVKNDRKERHLEICSPVLSKLDNESILKINSRSPAHLSRIDKISNVQNDKVVLNNHENISKIELTSTSVDNNFNSPYKSNSVLTSEEDSISKTSLASSNVLDASMDKTNNSEICVTPQKSQSFESNCLFSPVTPINLSSNSEHSVIRYSTPNTNKSFNGDPSIRQKSNSHKQHTQRDNSHHLSNKKTPNSRPFNNCVGDFLVANKSANENVVSSKKKKYTKFLNLSYSDPMLISNKENARFDSGSRERMGNLNLNDKDVFPDISERKLQVNSNLKITSHNQMRRINPTRLNMTLPDPDLHLNNDTNSVQPGDNTFGIKYDKIEQNEAFKVQNCQLKEHSAGFTTERDFLRKERVNLIEKFNEFSNNNPKKVHSNNPPINIVKKNSVPLRNFIFNINEVCHMKTLDILSSIFSTLLDTNIITNVTSEMYYLFSLAMLQQHLSNKTSDDALLKKEVDSKEMNIAENLFDSEHNCIYFALTTLEKQKHLLNIILEKNCLRFLLQSERIRAYSVLFVDYLNDMYMKRSAAEDKNIEIAASEGISNKNVCFMADTDSADNFPAHKNFLNFKSQRDHFYEILRVWENNHQTPGWKFDEKLGAKVRSLLLMDNDSSNIAHLARLFKAQLLSICAKQDKSVETLAHLRSFVGGSGLNHNKITKLAERLTSTLPGLYGQPHQNELCSPPDFFGREEFFRDFILHSTSSIFREHLINSLIEEIYRLENIGFLSTENEEADSTIDQETKTQYIICMRSLKVLAKFLGYLMSLPYLPAGKYCNGNNMDSVLHSEIAVRDQTLPPIDLILILHKSQKNCRLILTIPWMVQLLSMLDYCFLRLTYFKELLNEMFEIYTSQMCKVYDSRMLCDSSDNKSHLKINTTSVSIPFTNKVLIKICLGWLFDMQHFPQDALHLWFANENFRKDKSKTNYERGLEWIDNSHKDNTSLEHEDSKSNDVIKSEDSDPSKISKTSVNFESDTLNNDDIKLLYNLSLEAKNNDYEYSLDSMEIVDENVIKELCPFLKEFRALILRNQNNSAENDKPRNIRHITPVTSSFYGDKRKNKDKEIQIRLEEWFIRSQPGTTRRILELVSERTGAALVRLAKAQLPSYHKRAYEASILLSTKLHKNTSIAAIMEIYNHHLSEFHFGCKRAGQHVASKRTRAALQGLLPPGTNVVILDLCEEICTRNALKKLSTCLQLQFNSIKVFSNDIRGDMHKILSRCGADHTTIRNSYENVNLKESFEHHLSLRSKIDSSLVEESCPKHNSTANLDKTKYDDLYSSPTLAIIGLKDLVLLVSSGCNDVDAINSKLYPLLKATEDCCKYPYVDRTAREGFVQLLLELTIILVCVQPIIINVSYFDVVKKCLIATTNFCNKKPDENNEITSIEIMYFSKMMDLKNSQKDLENSGTTYSASSASKLNCSSNDSIYINLLDNTMDFENDKTDLNGVNNCDYSLINTFNSIICPRNLLMIGGLGGPVKADDRWRTLGIFITFLLTNKFLTYDSLIEQCLAVYTQEWPQSILEGLAKCMKFILDHVSDTVRSKFDLVLGFLSDFCENLDDDYGPL